MTCPHTMTLGVYLLGALDPVERSDFESHLSYCDICRTELVRLSPLPGLLNQISPEDFADDLPPTGAEGATVTRVPLQSRPVLDPVPVSAQVSQPVSQPVTEPVPLQRKPVDDTPGGKRKTHRLRKIMVAAAAVVVLAAGGVFGYQALQEPDAPPVLAGEVWTVESGAASADARLVNHKWGTEIQSKVRGLPSGRQCYLVVYDRNGNREIAGWWGTDHDPNAEIPGSTSFQRDTITRLEYLLDDRVTIALTIQAPGR